jgi:hypothetical protein
MQILREVYPERSEWAQDDSLGGLTQTSDFWGLRSPEASILRQGIPESIFSGSIPLYKRPYSPGQFDIVHVVEFLHALFLREDVKGDIASLPQSMVRITVDGGR